MFITDCPAVTDLDRPAVSTAVKAGKQGNGKVYSSQILCVFHTKRDLCRPVPSDMDSSGQNAE